MRIPLQHALYGGGVVVRVWRVALSRRDIEERQRPLPPLQPVRLPIKLAVDALVRRLAQPFVELGLKVHFVVPPVYLAHELFRRNYATVEASNQFVDLVEQWSAEIGRASCRERV